MPIPASARHVPTFTKKQQQEQLAACYGVSMPNQQLSSEEVERMRKILATHDAEHKAPQNIDLNKPPQVPYRFQKFPLMVYDHAKSKPAHDTEKPRPGLQGGVIMDKTHVPAKVVTKLVHSEDELADAIADGWSEEPPATEEKRSRKAA